MGLILAFDETMWHLTSMQVWFFNAIEEFVPTANHEGPQ